MITMMYDKHRKYCVYSKKIYKDILMYFTNSSQFHGLKSFTTMNMHTFISLNL